jgi:hypothetical protein
MHDLDETHGVEGLETFRRELFNEGILHDGDTIGTDDETLMYARPFRSGTTLNASVLQAVLASAEV